MKFCSLFSGSSGNALFLREGSISILIDGGLSGKRITTMMGEIGESPENLTAILITHEHKDHIHGVGVLSRRYDLPIFANEKTWIAIGDECGKIESKNKKIFDGVFDFDRIQISPFDLSHDAANPVGFVIDNGKGGTVGIATDTGKTSDVMLKALQPAKLVLLESNHDLGMLETGPYPFALKQRVKGEFGHLSNQDASQFACQLVQQGIKHLVLGHLSGENNMPLLAYQTTELALQQKGIQVDSDTTLEVASRTKCSQVYLI